jgi:hypothetical protein
MIVKSYNFFKRYGKSLKLSEQENTHYEALLRDCLAEIFLEENNAIKVMKLEEKLTRKANNQTITLKELDTLFGVQYALYDYGEQRTQDIEMSLYGLNEYRQTLFDELTESKLHAYQKYHIDMLLQLENKIHDELANFFSKKGLNAKVLTPKNFLM